MSPRRETPDAERTARSRRQDRARAFLSVAMLGLVTAGLLPARAAVLFTQDFASGGTPSTYVSTTPNNGQWNAISSSGAGATWSVNANALQVVRSGNAGAFTRTTDFSPTPGATASRWTFTVSSSGGAGTAVAVWQLGSGFTTANSAEANASVHSRVGLNFTATSGQFQLRDIGGGVNSATFSGSQTILWVVNNSGSSMTYKAPDGTDESVANDKADVWVGTTRALDEVAATTASQTLTDWKFVQSAGTSTLLLDDFLLDPVPTAPSSSAGSSVTTSGFTANWSAATVADGYYLDVATDSGFTSLVAGYNNLDVGNVTSYAVSGLGSGVTYYYRLRAYKGGGAFASGASATQNVTTSSGTPSIALADNGTQVAAAEVAAGATSLVLHKSQLSVTTANATLTGVSFTSAGTYAAADLTNFKVWYSTDSAFGSDTLLGTISSSLGTGAHSLSSLSQAINSGSTGYLFITADIAAAPTAGNTVNVSALATTDLTFSSGSKSGSTTGGGAQTLVRLPTLASPTVSTVGGTAATLGAAVSALGGAAALTARGTVWGTSAAPTGNASAEGGTGAGAFSHSRAG